MLLLLCAMITFCNSQTKDKRDINQKYFDANTIGIKIFHNQNLLQDSIITILKAKKHTTRAMYDDTLRVVDESYSQIPDLSKYQNEVIYLMLISLRDTAFTNRIGRIIKNDVKNPYSESGGIIKFISSGKIYLRCIVSSKLALYDTAFNSSYYLPHELSFLPRAGYFHLHATSYNEATYAGPGFMDLMHASFLEGCNMDNEFVITPIKKGEFNIDYYGMDIRVTETSFMFVGEDVKVIDLGNYFYKIK